MKKTLSFPSRRTLRTSLLVSLAGLMLSGCGLMDRLAGVGAAPEMSRIENPTESSGYRPVSMPMPTPTTTTRQANSLWLDGSRAFFKDQRASDIGDIITVIVSIADEAAIANQTTRTRANTNSLDVNGLLGYEGALGQVFPEAITGANAVTLGSNLSNVGNGEVERDETINLRLAGVVTQKLPNGNLVVYGRQEVRVNFEVREIVVGGVIRAADITSSNTISYDQMAEARISYGGRGQLTDVQQPRYGDQVLDVILPF